jgi:hypothetical protein
MPNSQRTAPSGAVWRRQVMAGLIVASCALLAGCGSSSPVDLAGSGGDLPPAQSLATTCAPRAAGAPIFITEDCADPRYFAPYLLADLGDLKIEQLPIPHYVIRGGFRGTPAVFTFSFPLKPQYQGRFFQGPVHQLRLTGEIPTLAELQFAFDNGAYLIEVNPLQDAAIVARDALSGRYDPTLMGYRLAAAAAKYSRVVASRLYGYEHRPYGYISGGSGGAYMTIGCAENTQGVWDGFEPFVLGHPLAIPNNFTVRLHALRVLRQRNKFPEILDAIDPGGSGDPYATLNAEEKSALHEATSLGFPLRGWYQHASMTGGPFFLVAQYPPLLDPTYIDDFWTRPGYLGTDPTSSVAAARVQHPTTVLATTPAIPPLPYDLLGPAYTAYIVEGYATGPPRFITLASLPEGDLTNDFHLVVESGAAAGKVLKIGQVVRQANTIGFGGGEDPFLVNLIAAGDRVRVDNSLYLALQTYHRHQVPEDRDLYGWDQFRNADGSPKYPQRDVLVGSIGGFNSSGSVSNGRFHGKMILLQSLMDVDAFAWNADWYRTQARKAKAAAGENLDDSFRLWFTERSEHTSDVGDPTQAVPYKGVREQALRDLVRWVEQDIPPPPSTNYQVVDTQIVVPDTAAARRGIQPVVKLLANGAESKDVGVGELVSFEAIYDVPPGTGEIVGTKWDFGDADTATGQGPGNGISPDPNTVGLPEIDTQPLTVTNTAAHTYSSPGTYFAVVTVISQREGDPRDTHGRIYNLTRARVVVH